MSDTRLSGLKILCVEDEALVAILVEDILAELGCEVIGPFARTADALERLPSSRVDAALLDVNLSGERSYRVADALLEMNCPFVFLTGYGEEGIDPAYRGNPVLQKPFNSERLANALYAAIEPRGARIS